MNAKSPLAAIAILLALLATFAWAFRPMGEKPATPSAPKIASAPATTPTQPHAHVAAVETTKPALIAVVEPPKVAPAPAHDAPVPAIPAWGNEPPSVKSKPFARVVPLSDGALNVGTLTLNLGSSGPHTPAEQLAEQIEQTKMDIETFRQNSQKAIEQAMDSLNKSTNIDESQRQAEIQKIEATREQYDDFLQTREIALADMEATLARMQAEAPSN